MAGVWRRFRSEWNRVNNPLFYTEARQLAETRQLPREPGTPDDVPTSAPSRRPAVVLLELPAATFDLDPLRAWGFSEGPTGRAGQAILTTLACAAGLLDDHAAFEQVLSQAIEAAVRAGDLDHSYVEEDPDGHYDNTWLGREYRKDGLILHRLQSLVAHSDAVSAVDTLRLEGIRVIGIPFLGTERTGLMLTDGLSGSIELPTPGSQASLVELLTTLADQVGVTRDEIAVVAGTSWMTQAAMKVGLGTIWVDRIGGIRASSISRDDAGHRSEFNYRWSLGEPVPAPVDDLGAAVLFLLDLERTA